MPESELTIAEQCFIHPPPRKGTFNTFKWDQSQKLHGDDVLPMGVADTDFPLCPVVKARFVEILDSYPFCVYQSAELDDRAYEAVSKWFGKHHGLKFERSRMRLLCSVCNCFVATVLSYTEVGDSVALCMPTYFCFKPHVERHGRVPLEIPLILDEDGRYCFDFPTIEELFAKDYALGAEKKIKLLVLCSPNNPTGTVWTCAELRKLDELCFKYDVHVIADEVHAPIVREGVEFVPFLSISPKCRHTWVSSPSKTWNMCSAQSAVVQCDTDDSVLKFGETLKLLATWGSNILGRMMLTAAYEVGESYRQELIKHIWKNMEIFCSKMESMGFVCPVPDSTFVVWCDGSVINEIITKKRKELKEGEEDTLPPLFEFQSVLDHARILSTSGPCFSWKDDCVRFNLATPMYNILEAIKRIEAVWGDIFL
ncbi:cystathionine beta-lyase [Aduncisulcus paluster]|uniref:cysteine-S-conjugate beta-lyase n=1 Tax=Aduncisulcus paluster TaxID=2918883 RepID=A0ABQ5KV20_9EUKA|nr:cystathionine beta-lyase [Aduncisulcus paluster]